MAEEPDPWVAAGLAALTGRADGPPLRPPDAVVTAVAELASSAPVDDPMALLGERAALAGLGRQGSTSCGGATRLLPCADGWLAVALPRPDDLESVPAWLELGSGGAPLFSTTEERHQNEVWGLVEAHVAGRPGAELVERAAVLGMAVAAVGEWETSEPVRRTPLGPRPPLDGPPLVVDLSSLWAGPLCSHLLQIEGAPVVKVESTGRPDGLRRDPAGFFDLLNHGKSSVALDLGAPAGWDALGRLIEAADVVIEGSRARAMLQLGVDAEASGARVWVGITGHGRDADRIGFGDDTASAGGLVLWDDRTPVFAADAIADPLTGIAAAAAVTECLAEGGNWLVDVPLAGVAASLSLDGAKAEQVDGPVPEPWARPIAGPGPILGADTTAVLASLA